MARKQSQPNSPEDFFAKLRAAEEAEVELPAEAYNLAVNALAADPNALDFEEMQRILKESGKTTADLERHVKLIRPFVTGAAQRAEAEIAEAQAEVEAVGAERTAINRRLGTKLPSAEDSKQFEALSRRLAQAHRRMKAANAKLAEIEHDRAALVAEIRGEELPSEPVAPTPTCEVTVTPSQTLPPKGYDAYDKAWCKKYDERGVVRYYRNGVVVESA